MTKDEAAYQRALEYLIHTLEDTLADDDRSAKNKRCESGEYNYIPLPPYAFVQQLEAVSTYFKDTTPLFVDVGCGIGSKLILAANILRCDGRQVFGIEIDRRYVEVARKLMLNDWNLRKDFPTIIQGDALKQDYSEYDIIYFYCPLSDPRKQMKLEQLILTTSKVGTFIIANNKQGPTEWWSENPSLKTLEETGPIFKKISPYEPNS